MVSCLCEVVVRELTCETYSFQKKVHCLAIFLDSLLCFLCTYSYFVQTEFKAYLLHVLHQLLRCYWQNQFFSYFSGELMYKHHIWKTGRFHSCIPRAQTMWGKDLLSASKKMCTCTVFNNCLDHFPSVTVHNFGNGTKQFSCGLYE